MITKKRDQRQYDLVQQHLPGLILNTMPGIIPYLGDPHDAKLGLGGMTAYPPMAAVAVCYAYHAFFLANIYSWFLISSLRTVFDGSETTIAYQCAKHIVINELIHYHDENLCPCS